MKMQTLLTLMIILIVGCRVPSELNEQTTDVSKEAQKPNIIFILTDDQRFDAIGYSGNKLIHTPEMDRLAESGTYFKNATVTTPICAASRASILTGLYERTHRFNFQTGNVRQEYMEQAYPKLLKDAGYHTGFYGKYGIRYDGEDELFSEYETYDRNNSYKDRRGYYYKTLGKDTVHLTRYTGQKALDFIDNNADENKPFCLSLSFSAPHAHDPAKDQYFWQNETDGLLQGVTMPGPDLGEDKYFEAQPDFVRAGFNRLRWTWRYDTPEKYQHSVKGYYRMISGVDLEIGKIRAKLEEKGLAENTIIILMGDNGYFLGERQLAGKWLLYDNSVRVPLIVYNPKAKHQDVEVFAQNVDVPSTILDFAGVEQPETWQGVSLLPIVNGKSKGINRDTILIEHLWEFENIPPSEGVRTKDWKYFRYVNDKSFEELYDLKKDPKEIVNLAKDPKYKAVLDGLRKKCDALILEKSDAYSKPPANLSIEFIRQPESVVIKDARPEFTWSVPTEAVSQSAYQLLVASSKENIDNNIGDVWNSGQVRTNKSAEIEYDGKPLQAGNKYYWKVRVWDAVNRLSRYSDSQAFQVGTSESMITTSNFFQIENIKPVAHQKNADGSYFIDFGKDAFATLQVNYQPKKAETLTIRLGEKLLDGKIDQKPGGTIRYQELQLQVNPNQSNYQLNLVPDKRNTNHLAIALPDSFPVLMPFRYVEVSGAGNNFDPSEMVQVAYFGYFDNSTSSFTSSDPILNQVWDLGKYSMKATSFAGYYVDGERERIPYEADAYLNQLSHYCVDNEYAIGRKTIEYFFVSKPTWPTEWQLHVAMMMYQDYMYTGNTEIIEKYYERLKAKTLMDLEVEDGFISIQSPNHDADFLLSLGFPDTTRRLKDIVDWPPESNNFGGVKRYQKGERDGYVFKRINTVVNGFYYHNMKIMAEFATILDKPEEALDFEARAAQVKKSINEQLFDEEKGYYVDGVGTDHGSLHANMILLAFDVVPEARKKSVVEHVKSRGMACSVYGAQYLMEALYKAGEDKYAHELMAATHDRSWYNMIKIGSTITLEAWDMKYKVNGDWNHAWGAAPTNIIPRYLWGIQPKTAGYSIATIEPQMGELKHSTIEVPTIKGTIKGEYKFVSRRLQTYTIEVPANMVAEFKVTNAGDKVVKLNGETVSTAFGSIRLLPGVNKINLVVNSF